jgi:hypothetical protein
MRYLDTEKLKREGSLLVMLMTAGDRQFLIPVLLSFALIGCALFALFWLLNAYWPLPACVFGCAETTRQCCLLPAAVLVYLAAGFVLIFGVNLWCERRRRASYRLLHSAFVTVLTGFSAAAAMRILGAAVELVLLGTGLVFCAMYLSHSLAEYLKNGCQSR